MVVHEEVPLYITQYLFFSHYVVRTSHDSSVDLYTGESMYVFNFQLKKIAESGQKMSGAVFDPTWHFVLSEVSVAVFDPTRRFVLSEVNVAVFDLTWYSVLSVCLC